MSELALLGGAAVRTIPFPAYKTIGKEEQDAVQQVMKSGVLSRFLGTWHNDFYGGPVVQQFEKAWAEKHSSKYAVAVNSATSGLYAALGATGVGPGDEVIVPPYTMSATAMAVLVYNAVPVFADIEPDTYCISAEAIAAQITPRTKAIMVVHLFGQPADMDAIMALADKHGLIVIEDCAQAICSSYKGRPLGTLGHMGVFSLNYHKHIHTGEGGLVTTNDDTLAERIQLIRNHAEAVVEAKGVTNFVNMLGFNYRLGEIEAAIGLSQLSKVDALIDQRRHNVTYLEHQIGQLPGLKMPTVRDGCQHSYYVHALDYDQDLTGVPRDTVFRALKAELPATELREHEGVLMGQGYVKPLYRQPVYQQQVGYGETGCPFKCPLYSGTPNYSDGICPNTENAYHNRLITHELMRPPMTHTDLDAVADAFKKVFSHLDELRSWQPTA